MSQPGLSHSEDSSEEEGVSVVSPESAEANQQDNEVRTGQDLQAKEGAESRSPSSSIPTCEGQLAVLVLRVHLHHLNHAE